MAHLLTERRGPVLLLTLNRPGTLNGFDPPMAKALHDALRAAAKDPGVGSVVLTGAGKAFCAGGDVAAMRAAVDKPGIFRALTGQFHPAIRTILTMEKPVVAAVNGAAAGGGFSLALACDVRLASDKAKFKPAYLSLGVVPDGGCTWTLPRLVGPAKARSLLLMDEVLDAPGALALGLVDRVVAQDKLLDEAMALGDRLAALPRFAAGKTKRLLLDSWAADSSTQLAAERRLNAQSAGLPDLEEGLRAFEEKRAPRFPSAAGTQR